MSTHCDNPRGVLSPPNDQLGFLRFLAYANYLRILGIGIQHPIPTDPYILLGSKTSLGILFLNILGYTP